MILANENCLIRMKADVRGLKCEKAELDQTENISKHAALTESSEG